MNRYIAANGIPFRARLVKQGDRYGLNDCLTHDSPRPMIEFYDARYPHTPHGQFVSRYYLDTLTDHPFEHGLDLQGDVADWTIDADTLQTMIGDVLAGYMVIHHES